MLVLLSFGLVLVATVLLVLGLLVGEGLTLIYLSIGLSALAAVVLLVAVRLSRPRLEEKAAPEPLPEPALVGAGTAPAGTETAGRPASAATTDDWLAGDEGWSGAPSATAEAAADDFPIADYDELTVDEILPLLPQLFNDEIDVVEGRERTGKARRAVLSALDDLRARRRSGEALEPADELEALPAADVAPATAGTAEAPSFLPIEDYDELSVNEILGVIDDLMDDELEEIRAHEASHKNRRTILARIGRRLGATAPSAAAAGADVTPAAAPEPAAPPAKRAASRGGARGGRAAKTPARRAGAASKAAKAPAKRATTASKAPAKAPAKAAGRRPAAATKAPAKAPAKAVSTRAAATKAATKAPAKRAGAAAKAPAGRARGATKATKAAKATKSATKKAAGRTTGTRKSR